MTRPCWLVGHRAAGDESGYAVCVCGAHAYWDADDWRWYGLLGVPEALFWRLWRWALHDWFVVQCQRCGACGRWCRWFGYEVGRHEDCLPF